MGNAYLEITLQIDQQDRPKAAAVYQKYKQPFLDKIDGSESKLLLFATTMYRCCMVSTRLEAPKPT